MNIHQLKESLLGKQPPENVSVYIAALWYAAKGCWEQAHTLIQDVPDKRAAWIHAYLHRKEGDLSNAGYWYHRAGKTMPQESLEEEWGQMATALLQ